jgi:2-polyprenyl-3-methyl-5-hydroxy-6-metoxy-1,4-benzoquinol methylase
MGELFDQLNEIGVAHEESREVFSIGTRDNDQVTVHRDRRSGVIYIDNHYVGEEQYESGLYREEKLVHSEKPDLERRSDCARRIGDYRQLIAGRDVLDFGCGEGDFVTEAQHLAKRIVGVELQEDVREALNRSGILCLKDLDNLDASSLDTVFAFHVIEHLPRPLPTLSKLSSALRADGAAVVEVPHANDFLLATLRNEAFKKFTLWSQHLVLHTRDSLTRLMRAAGFSSVVVQGKQRYPLSNHLGWIRDGRPGGHKGQLSAINTEALRKAYEQSLQMIDQTDTLVAIATR